MIYFVDNLLMRTRLFQQCNFLLFQQFWSTWILISSWSIQIRANLCKSQWIRVQFLSDTETVLTKMGYHSGGRIWHKNCNISCWHLVKKGLLKAVSKVSESSSFISRLKEYYEIVGESRPLSTFFPKHADFFTEMHS